MNARYTIDGGKHLESLLDTICEESKHALSQLIPEDSLLGIALGGGYGRGEGGVFRESKVGLPYNDVEFFVFVRGNRFLARRRWDDAVSAIGHELTERFGIEVEFRLLGSNEIQTAAPSMFYYNLIGRHRWVLGSDELLENCDHHRDPSTLGHEDASRLLIDRASGLLFAKARLRKDILHETDIDFIFRNISRAQLAIGDAVLTSRGEYHWSCLVRHERLCRLSVDPTIISDHEAGLEFKLHPFRTTLSIEDLTELHQSISHRVKATFLEIESQRLDQVFPDSRTYFNYHPKIATGNRNRVMNFRDRGLSGLLDTSHPREDLLNIVCQGLWEPANKRLSSEEMENFHDLWRSYC